MKAEIAYQASIIPFKQMLKSGFISLEDYAKIDTILNKKYRPFFVEYICSEVICHTDKGESL